MTKQHVNQNTPSTDMLIYDQLPMDKRVIVTQLLHLRQDEGKLIFVFGSNLAGRHGAGAAAYAQDKWGAVYGEGVGHHGSSYAIPTKDSRINTLGLPKINIFVVGFLLYATEHPELHFKVTQIGCGLAGLSPAQIAPMFENAPENCSFDTDWYPYLGQGYQYWGHVG